MGKILNINLDVTRLDKKKFFVGKKGTYTDLVAEEKRGGMDDYGKTHSVYQKQSKEDREAGEPKNYCGSGVEYDFDNPPQRDNAPEVAVSIEDDLPF
jgi:hypothetical protein